MADLNRLKAVIDLIARLPNTTDYVEARQIGERLIQVIAEADIRSAGQRWRSYVDPTTEEVDDPEFGHNWQKLGVVTGKVVAGLSRIAQ